MNEFINSSCTATFAITVTYGDRYCFLQQVVLSALANGVKKVIVVDNGSVDPSKQEIRKLESDNEGRVVVVALPANLGSAAGFKAGLEYAATCRDCEYLWLLDDDNRPGEGALAELFYHYAKLCELVPLNRLGLVSRRSNWQEHKNVAQGVPVAKVYPRKSSFMGFHLLNPPRKLAEWFNGSRLNGEQRVMDGPIKIPFGPYGGLFFHKTVLSHLGYPNEDFFLYNDDTEYTSRLIKSGGSLFLVPSSVVHDLQPSWHVLNKGETFFSHLLTVDSDSRIYYATRNQSYIETHLRMRSLIAYALNKWAFFTFLSLSALRHKRWNRVALISRAVRRGKAGELGRSEELGSTAKS